MMTTDRSTQHLVAGAAGLVRALAARHAKAWPRIPREDFESVGNVASTEAAGRFEPTRDATFETFAFPAIRGAMIDYAHKETFNLDAEVSRIAGTICPLETRPKDVNDWLDGRESSAAESERAQLRQRAAAIAAATIVLLADRPEDPEAVMSERGAHIALVSKIRAYIGLRDVRERALFQHLYEERLTLEETAVRLGVAKRTVQRWNDELKAKILEAFGLDDKL